MIINSHRALRYVWRAVIISGSYHKNVAFEALICEQCYFTGRGIKPLHLLLDKCKLKECAWGQRSHNKGFMHLKAQNHCLEHFSDCYLKKKKKHFIGCFHGHVSFQMTQNTILSRYIQQSMNKFSRLWVFLLHYIIYPSFSFLKNHLCILYRQHTKFLCVHTFKVLEM